MDNLDDRGEEDADSDSARATGKVGDNCADKKAAKLVKKDTSTGTVKAVRLMARNKNSGHCTCCSLKQILNHQ